MDRITSTPGVQKALGKLSQTERERAETAEAERDAALKERDAVVAVAATLRYECNEMRYAFLTALFAIIWTSPEGGLWVGAILAFFASARLVKHLRERLRFKQQTSDLPKALPIDVAHSPLAKKSSARSVRSAPPGKDLPESKKIPMQLKYLSAMRKFFGVCVCVCVRVCVCVSAAALSARDTRHCVCV